MTRNEIIRLRRLTAYGRRVRNENRLAFAIMLASLALLVGAMYISGI